MDKLDEDSLSWEDLEKIVEQEVKVVISQQGAALYKDNQSLFEVCQKWQNNWFEQVKTEKIEADHKKTPADFLQEICQKWLDNCFNKQTKDEKKESPADFIKPFLTETFITRAPGEDE